MSQIDELAAYHFYRCEKFKRGPTEVVPSMVIAAAPFACAVTALKLYDNAIAWKYSTLPSHIYFDLCGFNTATTRARLKALCEAFAVGGKTIYVSKGKLQLFGNYWNGKPVKIDLRNPTKWEYV